MPRELRLYDTPRTGLHLFYATPIAPALAADTSNPKWIQLCTAGAYVYQGRPVNVAVETFDDMVRNFRAHPAFNALAREIVGKPDAEQLAFGVALTSGVIALNFDHPPKGGPRPGHGWFLDVERRGDQLWGLCWFDAEACAGLASLRWKWTSIEWQGQWNDNKGQPIGAYLSGVALTNDPFITGMVPIQMSARAASDRSGVLWFGPATDVLCELRRLFALPETADIGAVIGEMAKLRAWALGETAAPLGVDVDGLVADLRALLNLPTLAEPASIFAELGTLLGRLADEQEREKPMPPDPNAAAKPTELHRRFAARLSALGSLFFGAQATAVREDDEPRLILEAERFFDRASDVMGQMASLQSSMGAKTPDEMLSKLKELTALSAQAQELQSQINALLPEVEAAQVAEEKAEGELASQDVAAVMSRLSGVGMPEAALSAMRSTLLLQRLGGDTQFFGRYQRDAAGNLKLGANGKPVVAAPAERQAFRRSATEKFRTEHQIQRAGESAAPQTYSFANLYAGTGAQYAATERTPQGQGGGWTGFSNGAQGGQQPGNGAPAVAAGGWTWSRVAGLPPAAEDNAVNRIVDEMIRTEIPKDARPTQAQISAFFARVPGILAQLGEMPPQFFTAFRRAA